MEGSVQQQFHYGLLQSREHFGLDDLLDDQRHCDDQSGTCGLEGFDEHFRRGYTCEEMDVRSFEHAGYQFDGQTVHVGQREHAHSRFPTLRMLQAVYGEACVAPQRPVAQHHPFGESGGARRVVDDAWLHIIRDFEEVNVVGGEALGIFLAEIFVEDALRACISFSLRHSSSGEVFDEHGALELRAWSQDRGSRRCWCRQKEPGIAVVHQMVYVVWLELMEYGHGHSTVGQCAEKGHSPL